MKDDPTPFERFCGELDELVKRWRDKPEDDRLTFAEIIAALEYRKFRLLVEASLAGAPTDPG